MRRVAIIKPCCIGDAVMALPAIDSLHAAFPDAELHVWSGPHARPVFENRAHISRIEPVSNVPSARNVPGVAWRLRRGNYDLIVLLDRSRLLDSAGRIARAPALAGIRGIPSDRKHEIDIYLAALAQLDVSPSVAAPSIQFTAGQQRAAGRLAEQVGRPFVVLHPGGAENPGVSMHSKRWPAGRWVELSRWVVRQGMGVVYTGSPAEEVLVREIAERAGCECVAVAAGQLSLMESAAVASLALAFVGPDTGLSHLSAASGAPTVALFGPTNPQRYAPRGAAVSVVLTPNSYYLPDVDLRRTSRPDPAVAMDRIEVEDVVSALETMLQSSSGPAGRL